MSEVRPHRMSVAGLRTLLDELRPDDVLVPDDVRNLAIYRAGTYVGFIDLLDGHQEVTWRAWVQKQG